MPDEKQEQPKKPKPFKFIGDRHFVPGVPARDMTLDEWEKVPLERRHKAVGLGLYRLPKGYKLPELPKEDEPKEMEGNE